MSAHGKPPADGREPDLSELAGALLASYRADPRAHHINRRFLPSRSEIIAILDLLLQLFYPGYFGRQDLTDENVGYHVGVLLSTAREKLERQIALCLCYQGEYDAANRPESERAPREPDDARAEAQADLVACRAHARKLATRLLAQLPDLRRALIQDVQAAFDGDPAAFNMDEIILAYPGLLAITVYRVAHALHEMGIALMPRIMTEWAHAQTGADIHPGAEIGPSFFLDHATGVVVGETTRIGAAVKLYQGVTLGAISLPRDAGGRLIRGTRRHPTVQDGVTVYANATVLGGETVLGAGSVVGGSVFLTKSVPDRSRVAMKPPELRVNQKTDAPPRGAPLETRLETALEAALDGSLDIWDDELGHG